MIPRILVGMSVASWVDVQSGWLVARSNWDRYTPRVWIAWAVVCWLVSLTATVVVLAIQNADVLFSVVWTVAFQSWLAILLAANVLKSRVLMKATIWVGFGVVFRRKNALKQGSRRRRWCPSTTSMQSVERGALAELCFKVLDTTCDGGRGRSRRSQPAATNRSPQGEEARLNEHGRSESIERFKSL